MKINIIISILLTLFFGCSVPHDSMAGNGSETTNGIIAGTITFESDTPAIAAKVQLLDTLQSIVQSTITDSHGSFSFTEVSYGFYSITATSNDSLHTWLSDTILLTKSNPSINVSESLQPSYALTIPLNPLTPELQYTATIPELNITSAPTQSNTITLTAIPVGTYTVELWVNTITPADAPKILYNQQTISIVNSDSTISALPQFKLNEHSNKVTIDTFEDNNSESALGTNWFTFNDSSTMGTSTINTIHQKNTFTSSPGFESTYAATVTFLFGESTGTIGPYTGLGLHLGENYSKRVTDLSDLNSITFDYTTEGNYALSLCLVSDLYNATTLCFDNLLMTSSKWKSKTVPTNMLHLGNNSFSLTARQLTQNIDHILFRMTPSDSVLSESLNLSIDNVQLFFD